MAQENQGRMRKRWKGDFVATTALMRMVLPGAGAVVVSVMGVAMGDARWGSVDGDVKVRFDVCFGGKGSAGAKGPKEMSAI